MGHSFSFGYRGMACLVLGAGNSLFSVVPVLFFRFI